VEQGCFDFDRGLARNTDPDTSWDAAETVDVTRLEELVVQALTKNPTGLTTEELSSRMRLSLVTVSPRMRPLEKKGKVVRSGKRPNRSGREAIVWKLKG
jgi:predicted ArsR family transcriptional regulator